MIKNILKVLTSNFLVLIIGIINGFFIPKILSINEYANYSLFSLYVSYIVALHLGFPTGLFIKYGGTDYNKIDKKQYKSELIVIYSILIFFTAIGIFIGMFLKLKLFVYVSLAILPVCVVGSYKSLYQAWGMFSKYSKLNGLVPFSIVTCLLLFYSLKGNISSDVMIMIYLSIYLFFSIVISIQEYKFVDGVRATKIISKENWEIEKIGFAIMAGNYINVLFHSLDRMFINILFTKGNFAMYSFAMQMQIVMTLFLSAISQPLYYKLSLKNRNCNFVFIKELLLLFGSLSGSAYFVCSMAVKLFLPKYLESLNIISIYFAAFPVIAIITALYINLYKINKLIKEYVRTLVIMTLLAFILNSLGVFFLGNYLIIALCTTIVYYFWFFYSAKHFDEIDINSKDRLFLVGFLILFFTITRNFSGFIGMIVFTTLMSIFGFLLYKNTFKEIVRMIIKANK